MASRIKNQESSAFFKPKSPIHLGKKPRVHKAKTPRKQATRTLKRSWLRKVSPEKAWWRFLYFAQLAYEIAQDPYCRRCGVELVTEGHHPYGQQGAWIMVFFPFGRICHTEVEDDKQQAREDGWILYK